MQRQMQIVQVLLSHFDDDELLQQLAENEEDINMLFMSNETVIFTDGNGINR
jgi:hypothetical protein